MSRSEREPGRIMGDWTPHIPEVVAEIRDRFEPYEQALIDKATTARPEQG